MGPLLVTMMVFTTPIIVSNLLRMVRWPDGVVCSHCEKSSHIKKRDKYILQKLQKSFNDKTGTILHYKHVRLGQWMMLVWGFFGGPTNGISINYLARDVGSYSTVYYLIKNFTYQKIIWYSRTRRGIHQGRIQGNQNWRQRWITHHSQPKGSPPGTGTWHIQ